MNLQGKTIVVTGASSGIGGEVARLARFSGARVIGVDRNDPLITLDGFVKADLGDTASIDAAIAALPDSFDGLVNAAGVPGTADKDLVARVNYLGLRHLTEGVVGRLTPGASIVNFASVLGGEWQQRLALHKALATTTSFADGAAWLAANPVPQETCYQYFKEALIVWTYAKAQELFLKSDIRMNCVAPGPIWTPLIPSTMPEEKVKTFGENTPMKRPGQPVELASAYVMLADPMSSYVSGATIAVTGGRPIL